MHKFLMVDDEELIRTGFREKIDWASLGFEFLTPCANGFQALKAVEAFRPDVVMTDICMPQMDGLELCRVMARDHPEVRVVVLSGHDDFEYARESLRNRVVDYLLKPVRADELKVFLEKLGRELDRPRVQTEAEAFRRLLEGAVVPGQTLTWEGGSVDPDGGWCAGRLNLFPRTEEGLSGTRILERVEAVLASRSRPWPGLAVATVKHGGLAVHVDLAFWGSDPDHASLKAAREATKLLADFRRADFLGCGALGEPCASPARLSRTLVEAAEATVGRFFGHGMQGGCVGPTAMPRTALAGLEAFPARIQTLVREGDRASVELLLDEFRRFLSEDSGVSRTVGQTLAGMLGPEGSALLETCPDASRLITLLRQRILGDLDLVAVRGASLADRALAGFRDEISQRLGEPDLAIDEVSRDLQVSPSYLAKLLRRKWDNNFSRFLREARISKAKELLAATNLTTTLIAEQTGFHDYRYFSNQFKRSTGLTPSGYRIQTRTASLS